MAAAVTRWGIVGAGKISNDFCLALRTLPETEHKIVAVAARKQEDAEAFAAKHGIGQAFGSYDLIASNPDVDIVYIGVLHPSHAKLSIQMLNAGKHVLCEKPMAMSATEAKCVIAAAQESKKLFVEGFWSRYFPVYKQLRKELESKSIGDIRTLSVHFGFKFPISDDSRVMNKELGGGVMLDIGCYAVQLANLVFNMEKPEKIFVHGIKFPSGVDKKLSATLIYKDDRIAQFLIAGDCELANRAVISGTEGSIEMPQFWCPTEITTPTGTKKYDLPVISEPTFFINSVGLAYQIRAVREAILNGLTEVPEVKHADSMLVAEIVDEFLHQMDISYYKKIQ